MVQAAGAFGYRSPAITGMVLKPDEPRLNACSSSALQAPPEGRLPVSSRLFAELPVENSVNLFQGVYMLDNRFPDDAVNTTGAIGNCGAAFMRRVLIDAGNKHSRVVFMKTVTKWLLALVLPCFMMTGALAEGFQEGKQYNALSNPQPTSSGDRIEVVELFWYGCPHCYRLEPLLTEWLAGKPDDVEFVRMPAVLGPNWELYGKAYYTAELLGVLDKVHPALFGAIHKDKQKIRDEAALQALFAGQGVSAEDFRNTFSSFAVNVKLNNARQMTRRYAITGVPAVIINGKYSTSSSQAGSNMNIIKVMDYLITQERPQVAADAHP